MKAAKTTDGDQNQTDQLYGTNEALLRSEIGFWKELIGSRDPSIAPASVERMEHALALAEKRLAELFQKYRNGLKKNLSGSGNVVFIGQKRQAKDRSGQAEETSED